MTNAVFSCPKCGRAIGDVPPGGRLVTVCVQCRLKYEVIRGRVSDATPRQIILSEASYRNSARQTFHHEIRLELPSGRVESITFAVPDAERSIPVGRGDILYVIYLVRRRQREELLTVHNATNGRTLSLSLPGDKATAKAWWFAGVIGVGALVLAATAGAPPLIGIGFAVAAFIGVGISLGHRFMPHAEISSEEENQLTATQHLLSQKLEIEAARAHAIREVGGRRELRERLLALRTKMVGVGLDVYQTRIAAIDRAMALTETQLGIETRLRDGYDRTIQMIEIEIEAGATVDALDAGAAPHLAALAEMRDLEEQQADLARQISANIEVETLLKSGSQ